MVCRSGLTPWPGIANCADHRKYKHPEMDTVLSSKKVIVVLSCVCAALSMTIWAFVTFLPQPPRSVQVSDVERNQIWSAAIESICEEGDIESVDVFNQTAFDSLDALTVDNSTRRAASRGYSIPQYS